jgi:hypothetical protein
MDQIQVTQKIGHSRSKEGFTSPSVIYDLDDQIFETQEYGPLSLAQLETACVVGDQIRLSASWLEGPSATNPTRCIASLNPSDDRIFIFETASFITHRPKDMDIGLKLARIGAYFSRPEMLAQYEASTFWKLDESLGANAVLNPRAEIPIEAGGIAAAVLETARVLANAGDAFDFGDQIAIVKGQSIIVLTVDRLTFELGLRIRYFRQNFDGVQRNVDPPLGLVKQLIALASERGLPPLIGLIDMPIILPNGSMVSVAGYDPSSQLYLAQYNDHLPVIQENPSIDQLRKALNTLWEPFKAFPFVSANDRGGMLAALLTAALRKALPTAPAFGFDAPTQGSGKTLLAKCVGALAGEYRLAAPLPTRSEEELSKILVSTLMNGPRAVIFDNQLGTLDSASLAAVLTSQIYEGRLLGASKMVKLPTNCILMLTGNNLSMGGDMPRRVVTIRIDAAIETPFTRVFDLDPEIFIRENRTHLVGAALTMVKAALPHATAGRLGSFEDWDRMVAQTVVWVARTAGDQSFGDPYELIGKGFRADPDREDLLTLLEGLRARFGNGRFMARDLRDYLTQTSSAPSSLRDVVESLCVRLSPKAIGQMLRNRADRRVAGFYLAVWPNEKTGNEFQVFSEADLPNEIIIGTANTIPIRLPAVLKTFSKSS